MFPQYSGPISDCYNLWLYYLKHFMKSQSSQRERNILLVDFNSVHYYYWVIMEIFLCELSNAWSTSRLSNHWLVNLVNVVIRIYTKRTRFPNGIHQILVCAFLLTKLWCLMMSFRWAVVSNDLPRTVFGKCSEKQLIPSYPQHSVNIVSTQYNNSLIDKKLN